MAGERTVGGSGPKALDAGIDAELQRVVGSTKALAYIIVFSGESPGRIFAMTRATIVVGRDDDADMQVLDASVSAHHARIVSRGHAFEVEDLGSTNGMFVGGERVGRAELRNGDRVTVGGVELMFLLERPTSATIRLPDRGRGGALAPSPAGLVVQQFPRALGPTVRHRNDDEGPSFAEIVRKVADLYQHLLTHLPLIIAFAMLGTAGGLASVMLSPPSVTASSEVKLLPRLNIASNPAEEHMRVEVGSTTFVKDAERTLLQPELIRDTLVKVEGTKPDEARITTVAARLKIEETGDHLFRVTYKSKARLRPPPVEFLSAHLQAYVQAEVSKSVREVNAKVAFLGDQLKTVEADMNRIGSDRAGFRELNSDRLPEDVAGTQSSRHSLESRRADLLSEIHHLEGDLAAEQGQLNEDQPVARTRFQWSETYRQSLADVNRKLSEAYARGLNDGHPEIQQLKDERRRLQTLTTEELQTATSPLVRESDPNYQQARHRVQKLRADLTAARANLSETDRSLGKVRKVEQDLPRIEQKLADLDHRQGATKQLHGELFSKLKQAEIQLNLEKVSAESRYDVTPPLLDRPRRFATFGLRGALGLLAGLFIAASLLLLREGRTMVAQALASTQAPVTKGSTLLRPKDHRRNTP